MKLVNHQAVFLSCSFCLLLFTVGAQTKYQLQYRFIDTTDVSTSLGLQQEFFDRISCTQYIFELPKLLQKKGFVTASVDSVQMDSTKADVLLFLGQSYRWAKLNADSIPQELLNAAGYRDKNFKQQPLDYIAVQQLQTKLLDRLENTGYPFANVYLDSFELQNDGINAVLKIDEGPLYKIDSIRVYGDVKISNRFLQRYLEIQDGSIYQKQKFLNISQRLLQLPYCLLLTWLTFGMNCQKKFQCIGMLLEKLTVGAIKANFS